MKQISDTGTSDVETDRLVAAAPGSAALFLDFIFFDVSSKGIDRFCDE